MKKLIASAILLLSPSTALPQASFHAMATPTISGLVHLEGHGDRTLVGGEWAGTKGESRRMEGIALRLSDTQGALRIEYLCHLQAHLRQFDLSSD